MSHLTNPHSNIASQLAQLHTEAARKNTIVLTSLHQFDPLLRLAIRVRLDELADDDLRALLREWAAAYHAAEQMKQHFLACRHAERFSDAKREYLLAEGFMRTCSKHMKALNRMFTDMSH